MSERVHQLMSAVQCISAHVCSAMHVEGTSAHVCSALHVRSIEGDVRAVPCCLYPQSHSLPIDVVGVVSGSHCSCLITHTPVSLALHMKDSLKYWVRCLQD